MSQGRCKACGASVTGRFCSQCGAAVASAPASAPAGPRHRGVIWAAAGFAIFTIVALVVIAVRQPQEQPAEPQATVATPSTGGGTPPDISGLSLRQQFDTLYKVVMRASEAGDGARAARFLPMALMAYGQLDEVDADTRYHLAVLHLHVEGDVKPALLLADSIQATLPRHLFAYLIRGSAGQLAGDQLMVRKAAKDFLAAWDAEIAAGRPEYRDHRNMLDQFRERALKATSTATP